MNPSVNCWGESETLLSLREAEKVETNCIQSLKLDKMDLWRVLPKRKLHPIMAKVVNAVKTTIRRESPAPVREKVEPGWRKPPETRTSRNDERGEYRVRRDRDIIHCPYTAQL